MWYLSRGLSDVREQATEGSEGKYSRQRGNSKYKGAEEESEGQCGWKNKSTRSWHQRGGQGPDHACPFTRCGRKTLQDPRRVTHFISYFYDSSGSHA